MSNIEKIRQEIERRYKEFDGKTGDIATASRLAYLDVLSFLDTLSEEPDKSLEEEAENYIAPIENDEGLDYIIFNGRDIEDAFIAGAEWHEQQMMKEAVEGEIVKDISNKLAVTAKNVNLDGFKFGDKVKIIIVKK